MKIYIRNKVIILLALCLSISGCGYRFSVEGPGPYIGSRSGLSSDKPPVSISMTTLENRTFQPNLEGKYTEYLKQELSGTGAAKVVPSAQQADYLLKGAIESVTLPSLTFAGSQTQESRVTVQVKVEVIENRTGKRVWSQSATGSAEFFVGSSGTSEGSSSGLQFNRVLQDRALEQAGQFIAQDLADRFLLARDQGTIEPNKPLSSPKSPKESPAIKGVAPVPDEIPVPKLNAE